jgi:hypothetical protein
MSSGRSRNIMAVEVRDFKEIRLDTNKAGPAHYLRIPFLGHK